MLTLLASNMTAHRYSHTHTNGGVVVFDRTRIQASPALYEPDGFPPARPGLASHESCADWTAPRANQIRVTRRKAGPV